MIVKILKKNNRLGCDNWKGIRVLLAFANRFVKISLECIKKYLECLIDKEQAGFRSGSSCTDHIDTFRIIEEQSAEFRFSSVSRKLSIA